MSPINLSSSDQLKTGAYTLTAADSGLVTRVTGNTTITLPAAAAGLVGATFTVRNDGPNNGDTTLTIAPAAADGISGIGITAATNKGVQQLAANSPRVGDEITLVCSGVTGAAGWYVQKAFGSWTRVP